MTRRKQPIRRYRIQASTTTNTYVYCRIAARDALKQAERQEPGYFYFCMMAGVFAAFTVEAFLNHLGQLKVHDWEALERKLGPREKLLLLRQLLRFSLDDSKRPFQTLREMLRLRDSLAHGKTQTIASDRVVKRPPCETACWLEPEWKKLCTLKLIRRMVEDAEEIVRDLHRQAGHSRDPFFSPGHGSSEVSQIEVSDKK